MSSYTADGYSDTHPRLATTVEHERSILGENVCTAAIVIRISQIHEPSVVQVKKRHRSRSIITICQVAQLPSEGTISTTITMTSWSFQ